MHRKSMFTRWQVAIALLAGFQAHAQMDRLHGDFMETRDGMHAGNLFHISFYNDGTFGRINSVTDIGGEWLVHPGSAYLLNGDVVIGSEVLDVHGDLKHIFSSNRSTGTPRTENAGHSGPNGEWWTFLPLPGFANHAHVGQIAQGAVNLLADGVVAVIEDDIDGPLHVTLALQKETRPVGVRTVTVLSDRKRAAFS